MPLNWGNIWGAWKELISTVHVEDHKIEAYFTSIVENDLCNRCLVKQLQKQSSLDNCIK